jgi:transcriptional regulator with XRE-family HTH domain
MTDDEKREIGRRLKAARIAAGWPTARAAAERVGIREDAYGQLEHGTREPLFGTVLRMVELLGLDPLPLFAPMPAPEPAGRRRKDD